MTQFTSTNYIFTPIIIPYVIIEKYQLYFSIFNPTKKKGALNN